MTGRPWTWRERGAYASVITWCGLALALSFLVGCGGSYTEPAPHCGPACQDQRELEDEAWIDYQEWLAEQ